MKSLLRLLRAIKKKITFSLLKSLYRSSNSQETLCLDIKRWAEDSTRNVMEELEFLFLTRPEFRTLFFHRIQQRNFKTEFLKHFYPPLSSLYICTEDIGPGLYFQHGFSTIVAARRIGRNCWINQQVTIGHTGRTGSPEIGDDVTINAGAIVIGGITIGNRVTVGAGAVVVKSVPDDCAVAGNPAFIIKRNGVRVTEKL